MINSDLAGELREDAQERCPRQQPGRSAIVLDARRSLELNVQPALAVEAMFHRLRPARRQWG